MRLYTLGVASLSLANCVMSPAIATDGSVQAKTALAVVEQAQKNDPSECRKALGGMTLTRSDYTADGGLLCGNPITLSLGRLYFDGIEVIATKKSQNNAAEPVLAFKFDEKGMVSAVRFLTNEPMVRAADHG